MLPSPEQELLIRRFGVKHKDYIKLLYQYSILKNKNYTWKEALYALFELTDYQPLEVSKIIINMTRNRRTYGYQTYNDTIRNNIDLVKNSDGTFQLLNYTKGQTKLPRPNAQKRRKPKKSDGLTPSERRLKLYNQGVVKDRIFSLGDWLRELKPNASNEDITTMMQVVRAYISKKKISYDKFKDLVDKEKLRIVRTANGYEILPTVYESSDGKKIILGKGLDLISEDFDTILEEMTFQAFSHGVKQFLAGLMDSPVDAKPNQLMIANGLNRTRLIGFLMRMGMLIKDEKIVDKDEDGNPVTATMSIRFKVPKKDFDRKLQKLYIKLFEKNLPDKKGENESNTNTLEEEGGFGGATSANVSAGGSFVQPIAPIIRKKINK